MCDYSLHHVSSRPAKVADKLVTMELAKSSTRGFAAVGELGTKLVIHDSPPGMAVCLLPGTELAFDDDVQYDRAFSFLGKARVNHKVASFRQIDVDDPHIHHDALEFPNGQILKITQLVAGQTATVLQLPVGTHQHEHVTRIRCPLVRRTLGLEPGFGPAGNGVGPDAEPGYGDVVGSLAQYGRRSLDRVGAVVPPPDSSEAAFDLGRCGGYRGELQQGRTHDGNAAQEPRSSETGEEDRDLSRCLIGH